MIGLGLALGLGAGRTGGQAAVAAPVAAFTGTPTFGDAPLSVTFTNTSTGIGNSYLWEKNDGSGWVAFGGTPTATDPVESFTVPVSTSVRLTATNAGGAHTLTRTGYITPSNPA